MRAIPQDAMTIVLFILLNRLYYINKKLDTFSLLLTLAKNMILNMAFGVKWDARKLKYLQTQNLAQKNMIKVTLTLTRGKTVGGD